MGHISGSRTGFRDSTIELQSILRTQSYGHGFLIRDYFEDYAGDYTKLQEGSCLLLSVPSSG